VCGILSCNKSLDAFVKKSVDAVFDRAITSASKKRQKYLIQLCNMGKEFMALMAYEILYQFLIYCP